MRTLIDLSGTTVEAAAPVDGGEIQVQRRLRGALATAIAGCPVIPV